MGAARFFVFTPICGCHPFLTSRSMRSRRSWRGRLNLPATYRSTVRWDTPRACSAALVPLSCFTRYFICAWADLGGRAGERPFQRGGPGWPWLLTALGTRPGRPEQQGCRDGRFRALLPGRATVVRNPAAAASFCVPCLPLHEVQVVPGTQTVGVVGAQHSDHVLQQRGTRACTES